MQPKSLLHQDERNFIFSWDRCLYRKNSCARPYGLKRVSRLLPFTPVRPHQASLFILPPDIIPSIYGSSHPLSSPTEVATSSLTIPELIHLISDSCLTIDSFRHPPTHPPAHTRKKNQNVWIAFHLLTVSFFLRHTSLAFSVFFLVVRVLGMPVPVRVFVCVWNVLDSFCKLT